MNLKTLLFLNICVIFSNHAQFVDSQELKNKLLGKQVKSTNLNTERSAKKSTRTTDNHYLRNEKRYPSNKIKSYSSDDQIDGEQGDLKAVNQFNS